MARKVSVGDSIDGSGARVGSGSVNVGGAGGRWQELANTATSYGGEGRDRSGWGAGQRNS